MSTPHNSDLTPLRRSLVDKYSDFKRFIPGFINRSKSRLHHTVLLPVDKAWSGGTSSNLTVGSTLTLTSTDNQGLFTSQQLIQEFAEDFKRDVDYVQLFFNHTLNGGSVRYYVSNDASNFPVEVLKSEAIYRLPSSSDSLPNYQSKFNDLRVRIVLDGSPTPVVTSLKIVYSLK